MKRTYFLAVCLFCVGTAFGQNEYPSPEWMGSGEFVITGQVEEKPAKMNSWSLAVTNYLDNISYDVPVDSAGHFEMTIPVTDVQDIYLYLGDAITVFTFPGDTIRLSFNGQKPKETLVVTGTTPGRTKELELCMEIYRNFRRGFHEINSLSYDRKKSPEEKLEILNNYYDGKIKLIDAFEAENGPLPFIRKFRDGAYFETAVVAARTKGNLDKIRCDYPSMSYFTLVHGEEGVDTLVNKLFPYEVLDYTAFRTVPSYRDFLSARISS